MKRFLLSGFVLAASASAVVAAQAPAEAPQVRPVVLQKITVKVNGAIFTKTELGITSDRGASGAEPAKSDGD